MELYHLAIGLFAGCKSLENIELPTTLTTFGEGSFSDCPKLTAISIPEGTTIIPASFLCKQ